MRKIIKGAKYDTETAKNLGHFWNNLCGDDFGYMSETLYRTKAGKYFLHGKGGANSKYSAWVGSTRTSGEEICPMDRAAAMQWAEEHLTVEEYEGAFGVVDGWEIVALNLTIPAKLKAQLVERAEIEKTSLAALCINLMARGVGK